MALRDPYYMPFIVKKEIPRSRGREIFPHSSIARAENRDMAIDGV